jgi:hypothetical protein
MASDPYLSRYQGMSHQQLYDLLMSGQHNQVSTLSERWSRMHGLADSLSTTLQAELSALGKTWSGEASVEYQRRLSSIVLFTNMVSDEYHQIATTTGVMGSHLSEATSRAESPQQFEGNDNMFGEAASNAAKFSFLGPPGTVVGGIVGAIDGHNLDEQERQRAHQRMVNLVADLAAEYEQNANTGLTTDLPAPPAGLPGAVETSPVGGFIAGVIAAARAAAAAIAAEARAAAGHVNSSGHADVAMHQATAGDPADLLGSVVGSHAEAAHPGHGELNIPGGALLAAGGGITAGLGLAARSAMGSSGGGVTGAAGANFAGRPNPTADPVLGRETAPDAANVNTTSTAARSAAGIAHGRGQDEEQDEHESWLTEDDMNWGGDDAAPAILGGRPGADEPAGESNRRPTLE